jgi:hypothetical protein
MRMINGVHGHTADMRPAPFPPLPPRLPDRHILMVRVPDLPHSGLTCRENLSHFTGLQADLDIEAVSSHDLSRRTRSPDQLPTPARLQFDIVHQRPRRYAQQGQGISRPDFSV